MTNYIPIICFVAGTVAGASLALIGFIVGFRASFEIRQSKEYPEDDGKGLFKKQREPAEFELLEKQHD